MSKADPNAPRISLNCAVITISDTRTPATDSSGDYLVDSLTAAGHRSIRRGISTGNMYDLRKILSDWIADPEIQVVLTNGGTGFTHQKSTVAAISPLLDTTLVGFGELFRHLSYLDIGSSTLQSDAFAGVANDTLIFCMPGSPNACKTAWEGILEQQLDSRHKPCNFATYFRAPVAESLQ